MANDGSLDNWMDRIPPEVMASFTPQQRAALWNALRPVSWRRHPVNIRLSFPIIGGRYFLTVVGGPEKRGDERRLRDRVIFPLRTTGNILFLLGVGGAFYLTAMLGIVLFANLVEF